MVTALELPQAPPAAPPERRRRATATVSAVVASAVLVWFGTGLSPVPWLTWLAPIPILVLATRVPGRVAAAAGFVAWFGGSLTVWTYYTGTLEVPVPVVAGFLLAQGLAFAGAVALFRALVQRGRVVLAALAAPAVWAGSEYLLSLVSPGGAFTSLGYTQAEVLPVIQVSAVTGVWGVSFLLMAVPALAAALAGRTGWRRLIATGAVLATITLGVGFWQLRAPATGVALTVAMASIETTEDSLPLASPEAQRVLADYLREVPAVAAAGATVLVLPEKVFKVTAAELDVLGGQLTAVAAEHRITIVVGLTLKDATGVHNVAMAYAADGATRYDKHFLVTGWEDHMTAGDRLSFLPGTTIGLAICKDLDHPQLPRAYARQQAGMLLVPALDFDRDGWLHSRIAVVRGVENGITVVRSAGRGRLTASDPHGRLLSDTAVDAGATVTTVTVRAGSGRTAYTLMGDWFAWVCFALVAVAIWLTVLGRGRRLAA
ncbi:apolipoprotein N-acyltransferase [Allocatelliglobosispora scoriae]|uniref:Apolipoprotein N-acyltransferase n=1 Tax=Allocatelliglobosispora scoriae TaxID=643052 RepID=A0A841C6N2_9ACTN|nr:nitrilase-related carbon-nitrogen hydrolase [Allocatelliglobosispora scoriae]MBB5874441.1 apolipoprotein N-acyltransferase [Allocatelliglobosispora scoriae]